MQSASQPPVPTQALKRLRQVALMTLRSVALVQARRH
jgi:hypothetical protein